MELGQAEALRVLDHHQGRIRHIDPHLDHRRRHQDLCLAAREALHRRMPLGRFETTVDEIDPRIGKAPLDLLARFERRAQVDLLALFDEGIDDVDLLSARQIRADQFHYALPLSRAQEDRLDRFAPGRELVDQRHVELAIERERETARNRCRRHDQAVGKAAVAPDRGERGALQHAEAVLLVDDRKDEVAKLHVALDERVGSDDEIELAEGEQSAHGPDLGPRQRRCQQTDPQLRLRSEALHELRERAEMLLGQQLGRGHQRRLATARRDRHRRQQGHDRLATPDVALEQAIHRMRLREVLEDLAHHAPLRPGQPVGQRFGRVPGFGAAGIDRHPRLACDLRTAHREAELEQVELFEDEPLVGR